MRLARRYAAPLAFPGWEQPGDYVGRLPDLATALAEYNLLVLAGDIDAEDQITGWVEGYVRLYDTLCQALFPSYATIQAYYADDGQPPVVVLNGEAAPVLMMLAGYIAPFVVSRRGVNVSDFELRGLIDLVLDDLEAHDLERGELRRLRDEAIDRLRQLLASPVRQLHLTAPVAALARSFDVGATPVDPMSPPEAIPNVPVVPSPGVQPSAPPDMLPEEDALAEDESRPFSATIPIFYEQRPPPRRRPPVPDLPEDLK